MIDLASTALAALATSSPWTPVLAAGCGALSSLGPCTAPRAAVITALASNASRRDARLLSAGFVLGVCLCYAAIGYLAACAGHVTLGSPYLYGGAALLLCVGGAHAIATAGRACRPGCGVSPSAGFAFGALTAAMASPCCTVLLVPIVLSAAQSGRPAYAAALTGCFALGHALPATALAAAANARRWKEFRTRWMPAVQTVAGAVMLGTGLYYGALA